MKIVIADDHAIVRQGIHQVLGQSRSYSVVDEVTTVDGILPSVRQHQPDLLILDYKMPEGDTYAISQVIKKEHSKTRIIIFTGIESPSVIQHLSESNIDGLLLKDDKPEVLLTAIDYVTKGKQYISSLVKPYLEQMDLKLSPREFQLLNLIARGWPRKKIAEHLGVTVETIKTYRKTLMRKLNVHTVTELITTSQKLKLL